MVNVDAQVVVMKQESQVNGDGQVRVIADDTQVRIELWSRGERLACVRLSKPGAELLEQAIKAARRIAR